jgi:hypothetical protein
LKRGTNFKKKNAGLVFFNLQRDKKEKSKGRKTMRRTEEKEKKGRRGEVKLP